MFNTIALTLPKRLYYFYRDYFGLQDQKRYNSLLAIGIVVGNISLAIVLTFMNAALTALIGTLSLPGVTYAAFFGAVGYFLFTIVLYASIWSMNDAFANRLGASLSDMMSRSFINRWINSRTYHNKKTDAEKTIGYDSKQLGNDVVMITNKFLMTAFNSIVGFVGLITLSSPILIPIMGYTLVIPAYLAIMTIIYSLFYNWVTEKTGAHLRKAEHELKKTEVHLTGHLHHIETHGESIAFKKGGNFEKNALHHTLNKNQKAKKRAGFIHAMLVFIQTIHSEISGIIGIIFSAPNIISGKLALGDIFLIGHHFQCVARIFTFQHENYSKMAQIEVLLSRLEIFQNLLNKNETQQAKPAILFSNTEKKELTVKSLSLKTPNGQEILNNINFTLPIGSITLIQGPSGVGKSSLFKALSGMSLLSHGKVILPNSAKTCYFIPQKPYFPFQCTLFDAIIYPEDRSIFQNNISEIKNKVKNWMRLLNFKEETIENLDTVKEWEKKLSGGEQQRIAIIAALLAKPDILFMDEATSALDSVNKQSVEKLLKETLNQSTIAYIDHNPLHHNALHPTPVLNAFHNRTIVLKKPDENSTEQKNNLQLAKIIIR